LEPFLQHHGIKGMHWGIHKQHEELGYKVYGDGRIEIQSGTQMQRLVASKLKNTSSRPLKDYAFASFLPTDNAQYVYKMAPKTKASGSDLKRDTILVLKTKQKLKSPSLDEAQQINIQIMKKHADELREYSKAVREKKKFSLSKETDAYFSMITKEAEEFDNLESYTKNEAMHNEFKSMTKSDPVTLNTDLLYHPEKYPAFMYAIANRHIGNDDPEVEPFKKELLGAIESKGYNMVRDETDARTGLWEAPVIVLKPEDNIEISLSKKISGRTLRQSQQYIDKAKRDWNQTSK
jgi:hypothetical protein